MNGNQLKKKNPIKFPNFKEDFKNLKYFLIGSTISAQNVLSDNKKMQSDSQLMIKDSMKGQIKSFFLIDKEFSADNVKKIIDEYKNALNLNKKIKILPSIFKNISNHQN